MEFNLAKNRMFGSRSFQINIPILFFKLFYYIAKEIEMNSENRYSLKENILKKKEFYNKQISLCYKEIDYIYSKLKFEFSDLYPCYAYFDYFDITHIDFWFGEIACEYNGDDFDLSERLFKLNENLSDVDVFELTADDLIKLFTLLCELKNDLLGIDSKIKIQNDQSINSILGDLKILVDDITSSECIGNSMIVSIQKLYVLLDFGLHQNDPTYNKLRALHKQFLSKQDYYYDQIAKFEKEVNVLNKELEKINLEIESPFSSDDELATMDIICEAPLDVSQTQPSLEANPTVIGSKKTRRIKTILLSPLWALISVLEFYVIYVISFLILGLIFVAISNIPVLNFLIDWLFKIREDSPDMVVALASATLGYIGINLTLGKLNNKINSLKEYALLIAGIVLFAINIFALVLNLFLHESIFVNIIIGITGVVMILKRKDN